MGEAAERGEMCKQLEAFADPAVRAVFESYPPVVQGPLLRLRHMILETAAATEGVGPLQETLKWGQPSYLTAQSKSGSTIRIDGVRGRDDRYALFCHCGSGLIESFRERYPDLFVFGGKRALVFETGAEPPEAALRHCIALALTHHARKKRGG
jgi:hypothetical protein